MSQKTKNKMFVMRAIILAAGKGKRLGEITQKVPKPMLRVAGENILEHNLRLLKRYGVKEVFINLHYLPKVIKSYFKDGTGVGLKINYSYEKKILGTAGGVKRIIENHGKQKWDENFIVIYGDNFYPWSYDLRKITRFHLKKGCLATIGLYRKKSEIHKSGVVILDNNKKVVRFIEKPQKRDFKGVFINTGIYILNKKIIDHLPRGFSDFGRGIFPDLIKKNFCVYGYIFNGDLIAVDTPKLYKRITS
jgi:mannose-1-phosphate guanylyltransferase/mannose-1-phosphate guanylyltransferase/phosphomannomutase